MTLVDEGRTVITRDERAAEEGRLLGRVTAGGVEGREDELRAANGVSEVDAHVDRGVKVSLGTTNDGEHRADGQDARNVEAGEADRVEGLLDREGTLVDI